MKNIIQELEGNLTKLGLTIGEKKEDDYAYLITVSNEEKGDFVIYTTQKACQHENRACFRMYLVQEHIPFNEITSEKINEFIWNYEKYCLERDLPMICSPKTEDIFTRVYVDIVKRSEKRLDTYKYIVSGITVDEVLNRIML